MSIPSVVDGQVDKEAARLIWQVKQRWVRWFDPMWVKLLFRWTSILCLLLKKFLYPHSKIVPSAWSFKLNFYSSSPQNLIKLFYVSLCRRFLIGHKLVYTIEQNQSLRYATQVFITLTLNQKQTKQRRLTNVFFQGGQQPKQTYKFDYKNSSGFFYINTRILFQNFSLFECFGPHLTCLTTSTKIFLKKVLWVPNKPASKSIRRNGIRSLYYWTRSREHYHWVKLTIKCGFLILLII
jgi:hypothetical protein